MRLLNQIGILTVVATLSLASHQRISAQTTAVESADYLRKMYSDLKGKYKMLGNLRFSGTMRMTGYYRNMSNAYSDLESTSRNLSFSPYPVELSEATDGTNRGQPLLSLVIEGTPKENAYFKVGYSLNHAFLGLGSDSSRQAGIRQFLKFEGRKRTSIGDVIMIAGGGSNWVSISDLTMSRKEYRVEPYEKLPWDWYTNSPKKYIDYQRKYTIRTDERFGQTATQGVSLNILNMPGDFAFKVFYGKTNRNLSPNFADFPFNTFATRISKKTGAKSVFGTNYYNQFGNTDRINSIKDKRQIATSDWRFHTPNFFLKAEVGGGGILNPFTNDTWQWGEALNLQMRFSKAITTVPLSLQVYSIDHNVVSQESAAFNSNIKAPSGGVSRNIEFDGNMFVNVLQEVNMIANNRIGGILKMDEKFGKFKVEFGNAMSVERENLYDTITIQHRVNSFTRSRFNPFKTGTGPYQRLRNRFMRAFETLGVTDSVSNYKKGFNSLDLALKYRVGKDKRGVVLVNYNYFGSVGEGFKALPGFGSKQFYRVMYEEFSAYWLVRKNVVILGFAGVEKILGNDRTLLSPENGKPVDQTGYGFGIGLDWDFMNNAGLFFRHKWFDHKDKNFVLDRFRGQETSLEMKIFF